MNRSATKVVSHAPDHQRQPLPPVIDDRYFPYMRKTYRYFSRDGIMTHSSGVMSGGLKIRLRKAFRQKTRVSVSYEDHSVFIEVKGSPLEGDISPQDIFARLRTTGTVIDPEAH